MNKKIITKVIYIFLLLQPFIDMSTSLMVRYCNTNLTVGMITRGLFLAFLVIYSLFCVKSKYKKNLIIYIISILVFNIIYFLTKGNIFSVTFLKTELIYMFKFWYLPTLIFCMINCYNQLELDKNFIEKILFVNLISISILIIIPYILGTGFDSYGDGGGGSNGWFYAANEIGAILIILFPFVYSFLKRITLNKRNITLIIIPIVAIIFSIMIIGTKTALFGLIISAFCFFLYFLITKHKNGKILLFISIGIFVASLVTVPLLPATKNFEASIEQKMGEETKKTDTPKAPTTSTTPSKRLNENSKNIIEKYISIIFSNRQIYLKNTNDIYINSNLVDKLFGIGFVNRGSIDNPNVEKLIEIDILDVFYHYGIVGFLLYIASIFTIIYNSLKNFFKSKMKVEYSKFLYLYITLLAFGVSCIAGHIYNAPSVSTYLIFIFSMLFLSNNGELK